MKEIINTAQLAIASLGGAIGAISLIVQMPLLQANLMLRLAKVMPKQARLIRLRVNKTLNRVKLMRLLVNKLLRQVKLMH